LPLKDLEWSFMPALMHEQFRIFRFGPLPGLDPSKISIPGFDKNALEMLPLGVAIWAKLSEEAERKLEKGERLAPGEWNSGERVWLVELISPFSTPQNKLQDAMLLDLMSGPFKQTPFFLHRTDPNTGRRDKVSISSHVRDSAAAAQT
jgi:cytolysin-activating lysine-acyltransferase